MPSLEQDRGYATAFGPLAGTYLEDSWVLDLSDAGLAVTFALDLVLTPEHRLYPAPAYGEQYCQGRVQLVDATPAC
jgi:hypothetical protein